MNEQLTITKKGYIVTGENCTTCVFALEGNSLRGNNWKIIRRSCMVRNFPIIVNNEIVDNPHKIWKMVWCRKDRRKHSELFKCDEYEER